MISSIHHVSLIVAETKKALVFYNDILGLEIEEKRPQLEFPGAWLKVGQQHIHLLEVPNPDPVDGRPHHGGRDRHLAMFVNDIDILQRRLEQAMVPYTCSRSGRPALFCRDPDGNAIELIEEEHDNECKSR